MLSAGSYHTLKVNRISDHGLYLIDAESGEEVLLPNRYVSLGDREGDTKEVFVYHDSENRLIATTERPLATAGEAAFLKVVDKNVHGAFLDWGITAKDLFVPNSNQTYGMEPGRSYVVFVYRDNVSGRVVATTKLNGFLSNGEVALRVRDEVDVLVAQRFGSGFRVIVNNRHWGVIYDNQIFRRISIGEKFKGYVRYLAEDNRIDISLQKQGFDEVRDSAERLLAIIEGGGGTLDLNDSSPPELVAEKTQMSKKVFKRSLGYLLSHGRVRMENDRVTLTGK